MDKTSTNLIGETFGRLTVIDRSDDYICLVQVGTIGDGNVNVLVKIKQLLLCEKIISKQKTEYVRVDVSKKRRLRKE